MVQKWRPTLLIFAGLWCVPANSAVTYTFFDELSPSTVDLGFSVASQLSPTEAPEALANVTGAFASDFVGESAGYLQGPPGRQHVIDINGLNGFFADIAFISFPFGEASNGVPSNGASSISGDINDFPGPVFQLVGAFRRLLNVTRTEPPTKRLPP